MPRHVNVTSFKVGHVRLNTSIERQRKTLQARGWPTYLLKRGGKPDNIMERSCERCQSVYKPLSQTQRWCKCCVPTKASRSLMLRYGINEADVSLMIQKQGGHCALCSRPATAVDHCHITDKVRGILCYSCNLKLSGLDDIEWRQLAEVYRAICQRSTA